MEEHTDDREFDLHDRSRPTGQLTPDGHEIRHIGAPILAFDPRTNNTAMPERYRGDPLIDGRYFYTLPKRVLDLVAEHVGVERFSGEALQMERELSMICGDHSSNVGFRDKVAISYSELRTMSPLSFTDENYQSIGMDPVAARLAEKTYKDCDSKPIKRFAKGYCGWLLTNRSFLDEHDSLLSKHRIAVQRWGTFQPASSLPDSYRQQLIPGTDPHSDPEWTSYSDECTSFCTRWRLSHLAAPYLPVPAQPKLAGIIPSTCIQQLIDAGGIFFLPDTMPIPSRDHLRSLLEHALHRKGDNQHLSEWMEIVRADNMARNKMAPFGRWFEEQHYFRLLQQRYPKAFYRRIGKVNDALAVFFGITEKKVKADFAEIRKRLGKDWLQRPWPLDACEEGKERK